MEITGISSQLVQDALVDATQIAFRRLCADTSIFFLNKNGKLKLAAWEGCDTCDLQFTMDGTLEEFFSDQPILKIRPGDGNYQKFASIFQSLRLRNCWLMPIRLEGRVLGIWLIGSKSETLFEESQEFLFHKLAENIGLSLQNDLLSVENLHYRREAETIYKIGAEISQYLNIDQVLKVIVEKACEILNAEISYLALADDEAQMIRVRITHGTRNDALKTLTHKYGEGVGGMVAVTHTPVIVDNYPDGDWPKPHGVPDLIATENIISSMCVPMVSRRGLVGVLYVASREETSFAQHQLELLQSLGAQAAVAIENARLYDEQKASAESFRAIITNNERLLSLVLDNQGLQGIADTLSDLVNCPILVEDSRFHILCSSFHGYQEIDSAELHSLRDSFTNFWQSSEQQKKLEILKNTRHSVRIPAISPLGHYLSRIVVPIIAGGGIVGYVSVIEMEQQLDVQKYSTVEQTSIIFALEFVKQEAARTNLLQHVIAAQEEERKRIARELHDETSQALSALIIGLDTMGLALTVNSKEAFNRLGAIKSITEGLLKEIQRIISDLRPTLLDDLGLVPAIAWYGEQRLKPMGIDFNLEGNALTDRFSPSMETALFRIVQETITNIARHSFATSVSICLDLLDNYLILRVMDNGIGFDPQIMQSSNSFGKPLGLWGIQERARILEGECEIQTAPRKGTTVIVQVPMLTEEI